jgi:hypothetical protein
VRFDGTDQSAAMQSILDRGQLGPICLILDGSIKAKGLKCYSGTTVEGLGWGTVITQATATSRDDSGVFRNPNFRSAYLGAAIVDHDVVIRDLMIDGNARNGSSGTAQSDTDPSGATISQIKFWGIRRLLVENVYIYDPNAFAVGPANVFDSTFRNIRVIVPSALTDPPTFSHSTAAVQIDGPWDNILIDGVSGATTDDFIALNAIDGNMASGTDPSTYPTFYYGSGGSAIIRNICVQVAFGAVLRLLSGSPSGGGAIASIERVLMEGVQATVHSGIFYDYLFGGLGAGTLGDITFRNWTVDFGTQVTAGSPPNTITGTVRSFTMAGFRVHNLPAISNSLVNVVDSATNIGRLCLEDFQVTGDAGETATPCKIVTVSAGTVDELILTGARWSRNAATAAAMVNLTGGTVNRVAMSSVSAKNLNNVVSVAGATVGGIDTTGLVHRGAAGNASIAVTSGTLSRLRAAGSDTAILKSGTIASSKTDATEDA